MPRLRASLGGAARPVAVLHQLARDLPGRVADALAAVAGQVAADAARRTPIATGRLGAAIGVLRHGAADGTARAVAGVLDGTVGYAAAVEFGTAGPHPRPPRPFLRPAFAAARRWLPARLAAAVRAAIARATA